MTKYGKYAIWENDMDVCPKKHLGSLDDGRSGQYYCAECDKYYTLNEILLIEVQYKVREILGKMDGGQ